jgi:hypothetical protein
MSAAVRHRAGIDSVTDTPSLRMVRSKVPAFTRALYDLMDRSRLPRRSATWSFPL